MGPHRLTFGHARLRPLDAVGAHFPARLGAGRSLGTQQLTLGALRALGTELLTLGALRTLDAHLLALGTLRTLDAHLLALDTLRTLDAHLLALCTLRTLDALRTLGGTPFGAVRPGGGGGADRQHRDARGEK
ncbi:MAG: hypothetical protein ABIS38_02140 [Sphingomicrobium sp.]